ncbi:hypothetical protein T265_05225 [Opisthorchis viverrini]|uniref:Uncharacterized protein n=1 Tax=Opisthorchis viverrini TaxID=6198 RepID=A0A075AFJ2_OPIVI|nr:hypothetical protein T265_05225 [Opisthorchis viverrini]KER27804.1 hypothetical protein T265_05225 [Opisthorchis viverrini]
MNSSNHVIYVLFGSGYLKGYFIPLINVRGARWSSGPEREFTDRKVRGSNPTSASRLPLSRLGQPGSISALVVPSGDTATRHRMGATVEQLLFIKIWDEKRRVKDVRSGLAGILTNQGMPSFACVLHVAYPSECDVRLLGTWFDHVLRSSRHLSFEMALTARWATHDLEEGYERDNRTFGRCWSCPTSRKGAP